MKTTGTEQIQTVTQKKRDRQRERVRANKSSTGWPVDLGADTSPARIDLKLLIGYFVALDAFQY